MPVPSGSWNGPAFQYTVQADYLYDYNGAPPYGHQEVNTFTGEASQFMTPRPPQTDCNTAFMAPSWQQGTEHNQIDSAGCVVTHASNINDAYYNPKNEVFRDPKHVLVEGGAPINYWQIDQGKMEWNDNTSPLSKLTRKGRQIIRL